jgi:hypothetical protein
MKTYCRPKGSAQVQLNLIISLVILLLAAQFLHAATGMAGLCDWKLGAPDATHDCGGEQGEGLQDGGCCCAITHCDCDLRQGRSGEERDVVSVSAGSSIIPGPLDPAVVSQHTAAVPFPMKDTVGIYWSRTRAPSETICLDGIKLRC